MTLPGEHRVLYVIVCGAGPAGDVGRLVELAHDRGWTVQIIATPSALAFIDVPKLESQTGRPVRSEYRSPGEPKSPRADAIIVAPATFNTIHKWANGISDTYALGILAEAPGLNIPIVALPFVNSALAGRAPFKDSVNTLRSEGVRILLGPGEFEPHPPGSGGTGSLTSPGNSPWHRSRISSPRLSRDRNDRRGPCPSAMWRWNTQCVRIIWGDLPRTC